MANRVLIGNRSTGGYGLYVSKANSNVLDCDRKELLFDSSQKRAGDVYAGGNQSTTSGQNYLSTGTTKDSLGYIPLVISTEDKRGEKDTTDGDEEFYQSRTDFIETSITSVTPKTMDGQISSSTSALPSPISSRETASACTNFKFMVLKIPCGYGYMTSANFDT